MDGVSHIFILQKPNNVIGHLDNIDEVINGRDADVLITNLRTKGSFHKKYCEVGYSNVNRFSFNSVVLHFLDI